MLIDVFNAACNNIDASFLNVGDESIGAIRFRTTTKGNLPHLSYIFRNPKPLGIELNTVACYFKGDFLFIEVQIGK